jgi:hypothetical protein
LFGIDVHSLARGILAHFFQPDNPWSGS